MKNINYYMILLFSLVSLSACKDTPSTISLAGEWDFSLDSTDVGISQGWYANSFEDKIQLPGTTDDAGYGIPNRLPPSIGKPQVLHLTRKNSYVGPAWYTREVVIPSDWDGKHIELKLERVIWQTSVWVDGAAVPGKQESLISPHFFDLTKYLTPGKHRLTVRVDNRKQYDITIDDKAHAYTNETQIMWNGILGEISLRAKNAVSIENLQVYPDIKNDQVNVKGKLVNTGTSTKGTLYVAIKQKVSGKTVSEVKKDVEIPVGETALDLFCGMGNEVQYWSEFNPFLYEMNVQIEADKNKSNACVDFGMRQISRNQSELLVNGKKTFLRGTLECCIFPLTGYPPTTADGWVKVFGTAREWGLNHLRFHSWCPPEAAFKVADSLGFYLQIELPFWSLTVGRDAGTNAFVREEASRILSEYGNHPSFCFLSLGNELQPDFKFLGGLLDQVKSADPRHLYTTTSFTFERGHGDWPEPNDDFFITQWTRKGWVRGQGVFDVESPNFNKDYSASVEGMPVPVVTHEVGQYAVYPDLKEIDKYTGVLDPLNFKGVKLELEKKGLLDKAEDYLMASGKLAAILYKEEIERAMKTPGISGFQLLDLHDFPGQSTALVGLLNAFWDSKGVADAKDFRRFSAPVVPLARFEKAVYTNNESFNATIEIANYGADVLNDKTLNWSLADNSGRILKKGSLALNGVRIGGGNVVGDIVCSLNEVKEAEQLSLVARIEGTEYANSWKIWVYPASLTIDKGNIIVTDKLAEARSALEAGKKVLYNLPYESSVGLPGKFVPVFWSPVHFPKQAGTMGLLLNPKHKAFEYFPTEGHTDWQWWSLTTQSTTLVVDSFYRHITPLVECVDNFANNRRLSNLFETNCLNGKLLVCSMDVLENPTMDPVKKQLLYSLIQYMQSDAFVPTQSIAFENIQSLVSPNLKRGNRASPESIY